MLCFKFDSNFNILINYYITNLNLAYPTCRNVLYKLIEQLLKFICFAGLIAIISCASQKSPTGGPVDKTPPNIISTSPDSAAINFSSNRIRLEFDKWMNTGSINSAVFFSPALKDFDIEWSGKSVEFVLYEPLKEDRTYTLTLTNALKGFRGNPLATSYTLAFSTGNYIDSGKIAGNVYDDYNRPAKGILIAAYLLPDSASMAQDTLNPSLVEPDYIAQTDKYGRFKLNYMAIGQYRIVAIKDENSNLKLDFGREWFGVPTTWPIRTGMLDLSMRLSTTDTLSIELQTVTPITRHLISARFDRELLTDSLKAQAFSLYDSTGLKPLEVYDFYIEIQNNNPYVFLITDSLSEEHYYGLHVSKVHDRFGNQGNNLIGQFYGVAEIDTAKAIFKKPFSDSTQNVLLNQIPDEFGKSLSLNFSRPVNRESFMNAFSLQALQGDSSKALAETVYFEDGKTILARPKDGFQNGQWYRLMLNHSDVLDALSRPTLDTTYTLDFKVAGDEMYGGIEGLITLPGQSKAIVSAWPLGKKSYYRTLVKGNPNKKSALFEFKDIPEGRYVLTAYLPENQDSVDVFQEWYGGNTYPTIPAERFTIDNDTLRVRKRWTTADVLINLRNP